jgi:hypothetical protein
MPTSWVLGYFPCIPGGGRELYFQLCMLVLYGLYMYIYPNMSHAHEYCLHPPHKGGAGYRTTTSTLKTISLATSSMHPRPPAFPGNFYTICTGIFVDTSFYQLPWPHQPWPSPAADRKRVLAPSSGLLPLAGAKGLNSPTGTGRVRVSSSWIQWLAMMLYYATWIQSYRASGLEMNPIFWLSARKHER